jgi:hypothetical protein
MGDDKLREQLLSGRTLLLEATHGLTDQMARMRPAHGWSAIEVLAHISDVDAHWLSEALAIRDDPDHTFVHFDDEHWKREHPDVGQRELSSVVDEIQSSFARVLSAVSALSTEELDRAGVHANGSPYRVRDVFRRYPVHDQNHARQIRAIRQALQEAPE